MVGMYYHHRKLPVSAGQFGFAGGWLYMSGAGLYTLFFHENYP
jgi:hypothetical protein